MVQVLAQETAPETIEATVNYIENNGEKLFTYTGGPGSLDVRTGGAVDPRQVVIRNARLAVDKFALEREGFRFVRHDTKVADFFAALAPSSDGFVVRARELGAGRTALEARPVDDAVPDGPEPQKPPIDPKQNVQIRSIMEGDEGCHHKDSK